MGQLASAIVHGRASGPTGKCVLKEANSLFTEVESQQDECLCRPPGLLSGI